MLSEKSNFARRAVLGRERAHASVVMVSMVDRRALDRTSSTATSTTRTAAIDIDRAWTSTTAHSCSSGFDRLQDK